MAVVLEGFTYNFVGTSTTISITAPPNISNNDLLLVFFIRDPTADVSEYDMVIDQSGWTQATRVFSEQGDSLIQVYYKVSNGTDSDISATALFARDTIGWYLRLSGVDTASPINQIGTPSFNGLSPITATSVTTTVDGCMSFSILGFDGGDAEPYTITGTGWDTSFPANQYLNAGPSGTDAGGGWLNKSIASAGSTQDVTFSSSTPDGMTAFQIAITADGSSPAGYSDKFLSVSASSVSKVSGLSIASISKISVA